MSDATEKARRAHPLVLALAVLLALGTAWLSVSAMGREPDGGQAGIYAGDDPARVERLVEQLSAALLRMQREDGSFDPGPDAGLQRQQEQIAADALATAALVRVRRLGPAYRVDFLDDACERGLEWIRGQQQPDGTISQPSDGPEDRYFQIDATAAGLYALVEAEDDKSVAAAKQAGPALATFAEEGLRNGWSRALAAMTVDRVFAAHRQSIFPAEARAKRIVRGRQVGERRDHRDLAVAEAIVRVVLRRPGVADTYPEEILAACLESPPVWKTRASDMQLWWMQAWLVARSGEGAAWFHDLVTALEEEALLPDGRVPGGYYASSLVQTSAAILALCEGLEAQPAAE